MSDNNIYKIKCALQHYLNKPVESFGKQEWLDSLNTDGSPTSLLKPPKPYKQSPYTHAAGSGHVNDNPGFDIVRDDPKDAPNNINTDGYSAIENICSESYYPDIVHKANLDDTEELQKTLADIVFTYKKTPQETIDHHSDKIPERVRNATPKKST